MARVAIIPQVRRKMGGVGLSRNAVVRLFAWHTPTCRIVSNSFVTTAVRIGPVALWRARSFWMAPLSFIALLSSTIRRPIC
jgi:hypothetical protein